MLLISLNFTSRRLLISHLIPCLDKIYALLVTKSDDIEPLYFNLNIFSQSHHFMVNLHRLFTIFKDTGRSSGIVF